MNFSMQSIPYKVRHNQLMRQQEKMIQDMEKAVYRRETIIYRYMGIITKWWTATPLSHREDAQVKSGKGDNTKAQLKKKITETKKRIRQVVEDTGNCDHEIQELQLAQQDISEQLKEQHQQNREVANSLQSLEVELEQLDNTKHKVSNLLEWRPLSTNFNLEHTWLGQSTEQSETLQRSEGRQVYHGM